MIFVELFKVKTTIINYLDDDYNCKTILLNFCKLLILLVDYKVFNIWFYIFENQVKNE
jgi:hypothetical protein